MSERSFEDLVREVLDFSERKDVNIEVLDPWQKRYLRTMLDTIHRIKVAELNKPRPRFQWYGPDHILVWSDEAVRQPFDYYKSYDWLANTEQMRRFLNNWSSA